MKMLFIMRKYTQKTLKEIAESFKGIGDTGVSILCKRVERKGKEDRKANKVIEKIEEMWKVETCPQMGAM